MLKDDLHKKKELSSKCIGFLEIVQPSKQRYNLVFIEFKQNRSKISSKIDSWQAPAQNSVYHHQGTTGPKWPQPAPNEARPGPNVLCFKLSVGWHNVKK